MDVRRQFEVNGRLGSRHLGQVVPVATMVQRVLKLDQKFCRKQENGGLFFLFTRPSQEPVVWQGICFSKIWVSFAATLSWHTAQRHTEHHTLNGTVVFVAGGPGELDAPLFLVRQLKVSRGVRSLWWGSRSINTNAPDVCSLVDPEELLNTDKVVHEIGSQAQFEGC